MTDYLPEVYQQFERRFPAVKEAFDALGAAEHDAGPLGRGTPPDQARYSGGRRVGGRRAFACAQAARHRRF